MKKTKNSPDGSAIVTAMLNGYGPHFPHRSLSELLQATTTNPDEERRLLEPFPARGRYRESTQFLEDVTSSHALGKRRYRLLALYLINFSLRPTIRFAYWMGIRRCPSWTKTTPRTTARKRIGKKSFVVGPPFSQARIVVGASARIDAKMMIEMPLPMPRFVISSPSHIRSAVPAVSVTTIRTMRPELACSAPSRLNS